MAREIDPFRVVQSKRAVELSELTAATRRDMAGEMAALRGAIRLGVVPALLGGVAAPVLADMLPGPHSVRLLVSVKHSAELVRMLEEAVCRPSSGANSPCR